MAHVGTSSVHPPVHYTCKQEAQMVSPENKCIDLLMQQKGSNGKFSKNPSHAASRPSKAYEARESVK